MSPVEAVEDASVAAWLATLEVVETAQDAANGFGGLQDRAVPPDHARAARAVRARLWHVMHKVAKALSACGQVEALARAAFGGSSDAP